MTYDEQKELETLRAFAAGQLTIPKVTAELGPMSLWSKDGFDAEILKAVEAEREACAKVCEEYDNGRHANAADLCADAIRARGKTQPQTQPQTQE